MDAELYKTLGRMEQSLLDIRSSMERQDKRDAELGRRVTSLERSRVWAKAWIGGAIAASSGAVWFAMHAYQTLHDIVKP